MSSHGDKDVEPVIFREYIGVKPYPESFNKFPDIVNSKIKEFHFILGFAHETYNEDRNGTGEFADWDSEFTKQKVKDIKNQHPNVKVVISIGGRDVGDTKYPFSPIEKYDIGPKFWCENAIYSLKNIIQQYNGSDANGYHKLIDGIDINYEHINTDELYFAEYIGEVITRLKKDKIIDEVSIAPSHETNEHYKALYKKRTVTDYINWVNYQFYMQTIPTKAEFLNLFYNLSKEYGSEKLLAGASVDPCDAGNVPQDVFLKSCTELVRSKKISGIFIWNANDSAYNSNSNEDKPFDLEKIAQDILANHSTPKLTLGGFSFLENFLCEGGVSFLENFVKKFSFSIDGNIHLSGGIN